MTESFSVTIAADRALLFGFRQDLREWLQALPLTPRARDALVLAAHAAVANGIQHGNGAPVHVAGSAEGGDPVIEVTTKGSWTPVSEHDDPLAEHGRGVTLIAALTHFERVVGDDCVTIRLRPPQT